MSTTNDEQERRSKLLADMMHDDANDGLYEEAMTIRLTLAPGDHYDFEVKPFEALTAADYIRINEPMPEGLSPMEQSQELLMRYSGAPTRIIRIMRPHEVDAALAHINEVTRSISKAKDAMDKVHETLKNWADEHNGQHWTSADAKELLDQMGLFRDTITVEGKTFTAPDIENEAHFGQWIDLQAQMDVSTSESESYVRSLAIMMVGDDGPYPVQGEFEGDLQYNERRDAYTKERNRLFMASPWIDCMGIAAFFFSRSQRFALITGHNMNLLNAWLSPKSRPERQVIPSGGVPMPN